MMAARPIMAGMTCAALSACVAQPSTVVERDVFLADVPVTVGARSFVASVQPGANGVTLTNAGAVPVAGAGVRVFAADLGRDEGIIAKQAAEVACGRAGGAFQPQAIGRYPSQGLWVFDGACA
jgi:hypothetical protein